MSDDWLIGPTEKGIAAFTMKSWEQFSDFIGDEMLPYKEYIYRGQAEDKPLLSSLDRLLERIGKKSEYASRKLHLDSFKFASRGRRGTNPPDVEENDWWALGQQHGLKTPLLDWTESPFVALFFAMIQNVGDDTENCFVYALQRELVRDRAQRRLLRYKLALSRSGWKDYEEFENMKRFDRDNPRLQHPPPPKPDILEVVRPLSDENPRLVSQRGLFVKCPENVAVEKWIEDHFAHENQIQHLIKIIIPNDDRKRCLQYLDRMNINHLSLFPDLYGASKYCNWDLEDKCITKI